jgi:N-acetylglutamate synthase/N-acetylornithine aminotransferase
MVIPGSQGEVVDVVISASSSPVDSVIQAEAQALVLAGHIVSSMMLRSPVFFSDNLNLARTIAALGANSQASCWEIRRHAFEFQNTMEHLSARIFHVMRDINVGAHYCAKQAKSSV